MKLAPLHNLFLATLQAGLPGWTFVAKNRHFRKGVPIGNHYVHIAFVNHVHDFDATIDVAVEYLSAKRRACIFGAELGNIRGSGQGRYGVSSETTATAAAERAIVDIRDIGIPFLNRYSDVQTTLMVLEAQGADARLISPIRELHVQQMEALNAIAKTANNSLQADRER